MECRYCQAVNAEDDHRCCRCGRRLRMTPVYTGSSAAAPALHYEDESRPAAKAATQSAVAVQPTLPPITRKPITYQPSLFTSREYPRVVAFETIAPHTLEPAPPKVVRSKPRPRHRRVIPGQQSLEFAPAAGSALYSKTAESAIYCAAPVAIPAHRAMAAALDASVITIALAAFSVVFSFAGGGIVITGKTLPILAAVAGLVTLFYKLLWCLAGADSPGMRWTHLALVNFDGQRPNQTQRLRRLFSGFLSLFAAGLGLLWSLVDEETLTWHDHISRTFPTPRDI